MMTSKVDTKELSLADYQEYFVLDDKTGDLFVRADLIKQREVREVLKNKIWILMKIMSFNSNDPEEIEEHLEDVRQFESGGSQYNKLRKEYYGMRDALLNTLIERDGYCCKKCGSVEKITIDHIIPVIRGGKNLLSNLELLCRSCNSKKGAK